MKNKEVWEGKCEECRIINYSMHGINFIICRKCGLASYDSNILEGEEYEYYKQEGMLNEY